MIRALALAAALAGLALAGRAGPPELPAGQRSEATAERIDHHARELAALEQRLARVEDALAADEQHLTRIDASLNETTRHLQALAAEARAAHRAAEQRLAQVNALEARARKQERIAREHRQVLARQLRVAHRLGDHDVLKLLLGEDDPAALSRMLDYHRYLAAARRERIGAAEAALAELAALHSELEAEIAGLAGDRRRALARIERLEAARAQEQRERGALRRRLEARNSELERLRREAAALEALLARLEAEQREAARGFEPFDELAGALRWPVEEARIVRGFGAAHDSAEFRSQGVLMEAPPGSDVHAVSAGTVMFAGEFKHLGLLVILDHDNGYMSLYGYNDLLYTKAGERVAARAVIGRTRAGGAAPLYFEIRRSGEPVDPARWCRSGGTGSG